VPRRLYWLQQNNPPQGGYTKVVLYGGAGKPLLQLYVAWTEHGAELLRRRAMLLVEYPGLCGEMRLASSIPRMLDNWRCGTTTIVAEEGVRGNSLMEHLVRNGTERPRNDTLKLMNRLATWLVLLNSMLPPPKLEPDWLLQQLERLELPEQAECRTLRDYIAETAAEDDWAKQPRLHPQHGALRCESVFFQRTGERMIVDNWLQFKPASLPASDMLGLLCSVCELHTQEIAMRMFVDILCRRTHWLWEYSREFFYRTGVPLDSVDLLVGYWLLSELSRSIECSGMGSKSVERWTERVRNFVQYRIKKARKG